MRDALQNEGPTKNIATNLKSAALISFTLVLPLAILEYVNNTITRQNAPGLIVLFGLLWLLPAAFVVILLPMLRTVRAGNSVMANPMKVLFRVVFLVLIAMMWVGIINDQFPCFMGVANCD
jgi:glucan phosphoethanolaminetransferase (alkaline phosphatase superfamily)